MTTATQVSEKRIVRPTMSDDGVLPSSAEPVRDAVADSAPDSGWARIKSLVVDSLTSPHSKRAYEHSLDAFLKWCAQTKPDGFTKATVQAYRSSLESAGLSASTINVRLSAIRKLAVEAADNGLLPPASATAILRVKGTKRHGTRTGNWLTLDQAERLLALPNQHSVKGKRDRALLALLIGCGLRREELAHLRIDEIQQRDGRWCIVDLAGKGNRIRTVPMPAWTKSAIDAWLYTARLSESRFSSGPLLGTVNKSGCVIRQGMSAQSIYEVVDFYGKMIGVTLAPHDVRRTFAKLAHQGRAALEQIQLSLGHASIQTTERYLGVKQDLTHAPCDHLGIRVPS